MNKYKLIISDYDGTLAGRDHRISEKTSLAINNWAAQGLNFSIATGRMFLMIKDSVDKLGLKTPQITSGGAEIVDPETGNVVFSKLMDKNIVSEFISFMLGNGYNLLAEDKGTLYSSFPINYGYPSIKEKSLDEFVVKPIPKILVSLGGRERAETEDFLEKVVINKFPQLHIAKNYNPSEGIWDVTSASATKHLAALELMMLIGVEREQTIGVGDGYNDFPLLEACGYKVAMGNAPEDLKAIADLIVPSYQEDGVAVLINKLLS